MTSIVRWTGWALAGGRIVAQPAEKKATTINPSRHPKARMQEAFLRFRYFICHVQLLFFWLFEMTYAGLNRNDAFRKQEKPQMDGARRAMVADGHGFQIADDRFFGSPFGEPKMKTFSSSSSVCICVYQRLLLILV